jgi:hypothetical protein
MDAHDLYGLPLDRFVPERTALAKALRAGGRREEAAAIAKLAKPSVAAWAVNQLVRTQRRTIKMLFEAGDALQRAQADLVGGQGDARALRDAAARERQAVDDLTRAARGLLTSDGHELTPATLGRVAETLRAAALDDDARAQVRDGCLVRELRHVGLGGGGALAAPARARGRPRRAPAPAERAKSERERAASERAAKEREAARRAEADARRAVDRAARALEAARQRRDRAAGALRKAEAAVAEAAESAERAQADHRRAQAALDRLG